MANINEAYDLELFEAREPRLVALEGKGKQAQRQKQRRTRQQAVLNVVVYLALAVVVMAMIGYLITCNVRLTEMNQTIAGYESELNTLQSERVRLETDLASKTSAEQINAYALESGMLPAESTQIYYISAQTEDLVDIPQAGTNWFNKAWNALREWLS